MDSSCTSIERDETPDTFHANKTAKLDSYAYVINNYQMLNIKGLKYLNRCNVFLFLDRPLTMLVSEESKVRSLMKHLGNYTSSTLTRVRGWVASLQVPSMAYPPSSTVRYCFGLK